MIANLNPYPAMKDSGVPWLGKVPEHWSTRRLCALARNPIKNGVGESAQAFREDWPRYIRITDIAGPRRLREKTRASLPPEIAADAPLEPGDLLLAAVGATYGKSYLHRGHTTPACFAGYLVRVAPNQDVMPEFLSYWTECAYYWDQVNSQVIQSTIQNFSAARVKGLRVPLSPLPEQAAIVRYLDYMDRRIRKYIRAKQKLIQLLEEQKQAIIHHAVTRGLDPNVRLKPSGVEWLGDVPEHWAVLRSKYVFREVDNRSATGEETHLSMSQKLGLIPSSQIEERRLVSESYAGAKLCERGYLVLNRLKAHLGVFALAPERGLVSPDYTVFRPARPMEPRYFESVYRTPACRLELRQRAKGIVQGFWRLYTDAFYDIRVPVPPAAEQITIMAALGGEIATTNSAIARTKSEIALMQEYRTRLIADVVTGKLDVREAAAQLPDETDEPEPLDETDALSDAEENKAGDLDAVTEGAEA